MNLEAIRSHAPWVVLSVICCIALYFATQVFMLSSLPTDARRAPDVLTAKPERITFVALGNIEKAQSDWSKSLTNTCNERGCDFLMLVGDQLAGGMNDNRDTVVDTHIRMPLDELNKPVYMILGDTDYGADLSPAIAIREVRWATRTIGYEMPSSTYYFSGGPAGFWSFDTVELKWEKGKYQKTWLETSLLRNPNHWRIAWGHHGLSTAREDKPLDSFFQSDICDTFDLYISAHQGGQRLVNECGTDWLTTSYKPNATPSDNTAAVQHQNGGYVWFEITEKQILMAFYDAYGKLLVQKTRTKEKATGTE